MPVQVAKWDSVRDAWMDEGRISLFSELSDAFLGTFPTSGMTVNGVAYELPTWEPATDGSASSSLLPTVTTQDGANNGGPSQFDRNTPPLNTRVLMLPTPKASDGEKGGPNQRGSSGDYPLPAIAHLLPTPRDIPLLRTPCAAEAEGGPRNPNRPGATMRLSDQIREQLLPAANAAGSRMATATTASPGGTGTVGSAYTEDTMKTASSAKKLLQTPSVADALGGHERRGGKRSEELLLNGQVKALTGANTNPPSDDGNAPLDGQLPGQLNLLDAITDTD